MAGLSRAQITRLLQQHRTTGEIADRRDTPRRPFPRRYSNADIGLLAELDVLHGTLSGPATRKLCARAFHLFGDRRFERLAGISNGHLYNLRHTTSYQRRRGTTPLPTRPVQVVIGERRRPQPFGQPGWVRVDTVHQGDLDGIKGLYHVNLADEVTQFQCIGSVEHIHAACLAPVLDALLRAFPFTLHGFHADNGSEFINREVAALLQGLHIDAFTKSRARRSTDNALVESKNGSVIRKQLGHGHIPSRCAAQVNAFTQQVLSPYLNFHRPCFFDEMWDHMWDPHSSPCRTNNTTWAPTAELAIAASGAPWRQASDMASLWVAVRPHSQRFAGQRNSTTRPLADCPRNKSRAPARQRSAVAQRY